MLNIRSVAVRSVVTIHKRTAKNVTNVHIENHDAPRWMLNMLRYLNERMRYLQLCNGNICVYSRVDCLKIGGKSKMGIDTSYSLIH